ncbi:MAG: hypothetical protein KAR21_00955 [Spirochaetales bacterium]|nr:hypothetical protein [Spirochaetales bacterium]
MPEIGQVVWQVNFLRSPLESLEHQELSVFMLIEDEDGIEDIESIYLIHDESELFWKLNQNSWKQKVLGGKNWIGSNSIRMSDSSNLPAGNYRLVVIDRAGERDTREFNLSGKMLEIKNGESFPKLIIGSDIVINSRFSDNTLWIYDESMEILKNIRIETGKISMDIINNDTGDRARWVSIYSFDAETGTGLIRGPYSLQDQ